MTTTKVSLAVLAIALFCSYYLLSPSQPKSAAKSLFELTALDSRKQPFSFASLAGKVTLIVNVASKCGFTPQYAGLQALHEKYKSKGLVIIGFPCNQFGGQEPGTNEEITQFCSRKYNVDFPIMDKVDVNGDNTAPVYQWLKEQKTFLGLTRVKWNFEKFLVDKKGQVRARYGSPTTPESLDAEIAKMLDE
eukprot:TRINITY_DN1737_c0_g1_i1.p1 TRINITY_DN1737_c0_g1~~TRINITY_DN1737_c0_g1_i1.p1  ORF type:complete len:191 (+),score=39.59 TRINITY_DN1737_c0_g1_i1:3-575(+)